jgi:hypothetical protein
MKMPTIKNQPKNMAGTAPSLISALLNERGFKCHTIGIVKIKLKSDAGAWHCRRPIFKVKCRERFQSIIQSKDFQRDHKLIVNHSHSCGPVPPGPPTPFGPTMPPGPIIMGLCVMPNPFASPIFTPVGPPSIMPPMPDILDSSTPPLGVSGLSTSIPDPSTAETDFECRRCRFGATATVRGTLLAAPGPGVDLGGAAAIGTTAFPPTVPPPELPADPW